jgi:Flp pilus assembly protein TadG
MRRYRDGECGAAIIEFAVAASVAFMVLFGIIQCCLALYSYNYVSDAARVATRYASVRGSSCDKLPDCAVTGAQLQTLLRGVSYPGINSNNLTATANWFSASPSQPTTWSSCGTSTACKAPGNAVYVQVTYAFPLNIPFWQNASLNISSASQEVITN